MSCHKKIVNNISKIYTWYVLVKSLNLKLVVSFWEIKILNVVYALYYHSE